MWSTAISQNLKATPGEEDWWSGYYGNILAMVWKSGQKDLKLFEKNETGASPT